MIFMASVFSLVTYAHHRAGGADEAFEGKPALKGVRPGKTEGTSPKIWFSLFHTAIIVKAMRSEIWLDKAGCRRVCVDHTLLYSC